MFILLIGRIGVQTSSASGFRGALSEPRCVGWEDEHDCPAGLEPAGACYERRGPILSWKDKRSLAGRNWSAALRPSIGRAFISIPRRVFIGFLQPHFSAGVPLWCLAGAAIGNGRLPLPSSIAVSLLPVNASGAIRPKTPHSLDLFSSCICHNVQRLRRAGCSSACDWGPRPPVFLWGGR